MLCFRIFHAILTSCVSDACVCVRACVCVCVCVFSITLSAFLIRKVSFPCLVLFCLFAIVVVVAQM